MKLVRHALHCSKEEYSYVLIKTIDHDVLILLISYFASDTEAPLPGNVFANLYTHNSDKWYNVVEIGIEIGKDVCKALPFFYAFSGCDSVSSLHGKGKCTLWDYWVNHKSKNTFTETFSKHTPIHY